MTLSEVADGCRTTLDGYSTIWPECLVWVYRRSASYTVSPWLAERELDSHLSTVAEVCRYMPAMSDVVIIVKVSFDLPIVLKLTRRRTKGESSLLDRRWSRLPLARS